MFKKAEKICMEKVAGEQGLALQHHFPEMYSNLNFPKIETNILIYSLLLGTSNLAILVFFICSFHFWHSLTH